MKNLTFLQSEADRLRILEAMKARRNLIVVGGTGIGKTSMIKALIKTHAELFSTSKILVLSEAGEYQAPAPNVTCVKAPVSVATLAEHDGAYDFLVVDEIRTGTQRLFKSEVRRALWRKPLQGSDSLGTFLVYC